MAEGSSPKLSNVADVEIDANGRFKYVLIKVTDKSQGGVCKHIVRGFDWADYHGRFHNRLPFQSKEKFSVHVYNIERKVILVLLYGFTVSNNYVYVTLHCICYSSAGMSARGKNVE